jgi:hypothetical protein
MMFLRRVGVRVPFSFLVLCGVAAGCAPLASYALSAQLLSRVYSYHVGRYLLTQAMACLMVCLPAILLAAGLLVRNRSIVRNPSPIQGLAIVVMVSNVTMFFFPILAPPPPIMIHNYGAYGAAVYGAAIVLYLSVAACTGLPVNEERGSASAGGEAPRSKAPFGSEGSSPSGSNARLIACCAVLGAFCFVPTVYVHSTRLSYERLSRIVPDDTTAWWSRDMSPYVFMGLWTPVDTEDDRQSRLDMFRKGFSSPRSEWDEFRTLNLLYYIAWCFEFGKVRDGTSELVKVFGQPGIVRDLWTNGTRFTDRHENKAYRRIRDASRRIIDENLKRQPGNDYLQKMSHLLEQYEKYNP